MNDINLVVYETTPYPTVKFRVQEEIIKISLNIKLKDYLFSSNLDNNLQNQETLINTIETKYQLNSSSVVTLKKIFEVLIDLKKFGKP